MGWLTGTNWMQKHASFKSKHEKQITSAGIRANMVYRFVPGAKLLLLDCPLEIVHWVVITGA
jgi:hypothetical protein